MVEKGHYKNEFKAVINEAIAEGVSIRQIAAEMNDALTEAREADNTAREKAIKAAEKAFQSAGENYFKALGFDNSQVKTLTKLLTAPAETPAPKKKVNKEYDESFDEVMRKFFSSIY